VTPVSPRHLPWLLATLLVAVAPIHANVVRTNDECGRGARPVRLTGVEGSERQGDSIFQWTSREAGPGTISHALIRTRWPRVLADVGSLSRPRIIPSRSEVRRVSHDGIELPIHFSHAEGAPRFEFVAHLFIYRGRPVENVLPHQLAAVWEQLAFGRRPATVLMAWGTGSPVDAQKLEEEATRWIVEAWEHFESRCGS
jgi:hypothetical protein